jgi:hypothetical protein
MVSILSSPARSCDVSRYFSSRSLGCSELTLFSFPASSPTALLFKSSLSITLPASSRFYTPTPLLYQSEHGHWFQTRNKAREAVAEVAVDDLLEMMGRSFDELNGLRVIDCLKDSLYAFLRVARTMGRWIRSAGIAARFAAAMISGMQRVRSLSWRDVFYAVKFLNSKEVVESWAREGGENLYAEGQQVLLGPLLAAQVQAVEESFRERGYFDFRASCGDGAADLAGKAHDHAQQPLVDLLVSIRRSLLGFPVDIEADAI